MGNELGGSSNTFRRHQIMDLLFDQTNGLGLNFVRYNIGADQNPTGPAITRPGADMDGWVPAAPSNVSDPNTWVWDWNADATQRWVLDAAIERGVTQVEAFANSAPWWMTVALSSRGNPNTGETNLDQDDYDMFGHYLLEVTEHFESNLGIHFHSLAPMNEPGATWWNGNNNQEGMHIPVGGAQSALVREIGQQIVDRGLNTGLVAPEETSIAWTLGSYDNWGSTTRSYVSQINTHSYPWGGGSDGADAAALVAYNESRPEGPKKIYATEFGTGGNSTPLSGGITVANQITSDLNNLGAAGWTYWQAVEDNNGSNWGLLIAPFDGNNNWFNMRRQYYAMQQFASHIRPGSHILEQTHDETVAAYDPRTKSTTLVVTNDETSLDINIYNLIDQSVSYSRVIRTDATGNIQSLGPASVNGSQLTLVTPGETVTTIVIHHQPNLVQNDTFQLGGASGGSTSIPDWQVTGGAFYPGNTIDGSGLGALWTDNQFNSGKAFQTGIGDHQTDLTGVAFEFSLDVQFRNEGSDLYDAETYLAIEFYGADDQTLVHPSADDFQTLITSALGIDETQGTDSLFRTYRSERFVAPPGTRYVRPVIRYDNVQSGSNEWVYFDNAYLQEAHPAADGREWSAEGSGDWSEKSNWLGQALVENNERPYFGNAIKQLSTVTLNNSQSVKGLTFFSEHRYVLQGPGDLQIGDPNEPSLVDVRLGPHLISADTSLQGATEFQVLPGASLVFSSAIDLNGQTLTKLGAGTLGLSAGFEMNGGTIATYSTTTAQILLGSDSVLDGDFELLMSPDQDFQLGDLFELATYSSLNDTFDNFLLPSLSSGLAWEVNYGATTLTAEIVSLLPGDFDNDGMVDGADFLLWQRNPGIGALSDWEANYGTQITSATDAVPEPRTIMLAVVVGSLVVTRPRWRLY